MAKATSYAAYCVPYARVPFEFQKMERWRAITIDTAEITTIRAVGSYGIITLDVGEVVTDGKFVVTTAFTGATGATLQFVVNDNSSTGALCAAQAVQASSSLAAGGVLALGYNDYEDTASVFGYNASVALQLEWVVATEALTAGAGILYLATVNVYNLLNNG